ncbi:hypothetical protein CHGG_01055 [Chaetomium globosum CBS 148.51]|uniref:Mitochondrial carrier protein n=1 Tax=Chaetomium globosum (strain ATCC 6205 / CBS 148.51 / DSM 1962 / NBRC 6347 / NRRL 1970) TaxID=306901 RepID=Q2HFE9_CHAGB|nr:uncharacterized protein CHGG_01055 [Chaetomium globosum CBS 148.51]EAQ92820.1 hypothetical protein CHGG_01055 [Chaetomium globosum CBS 148.51]
MAIPANIIYFTGYEWLRFNRAGSPIARAVPDDYAPLVAGSAARILAATVVSPIELFRTRLQAVPERAATNPLTSTFRGIQDMVAAHGYRSLWRGLSLTLWRDTRTQVFRDTTTSTSTTTTASATASAAAPEERNMARLLWHIFRTEGLPGLFRGGVPRTLRVAPACAIMISSYEVGKRVFRGVNERALAERRGLVQGGGGGATAVGGHE